MTGTTEIPTSAAECLSHCRAWMAPSHYKLAVNRIELLIMAREIATAEECRTAMKRVFEKPIGSAG